MGATRQHELHRPSDLYGRRRKPRRFPWESLPRRAPMSSSANRARGRRRPSRLKPMCEVGSTCRCAISSPSTRSRSGAAPRSISIGLDEVRASAVDGQSPLDQVLAKLDRLERPPFRLSCRWADWLGAYDRNRLGQVSGGTLTVLQLDPLSEKDIQAHSGGESRDRGPLRGSSRMPASGGSAAYSPTRRISTCSPRQCPQAAGPGRAWRRSRLPAGCS